MAAEAVETTLDADVAPESLGRPIDLPEPWRLMFDTATPTACS